ncbi:MULTISPECIES: S8 family peptidase [Prauserella salsuginis group]|uniref:S8 family serine peptidase n=1 Tax=Prauserella salsuginis TaxID=387889 RepID=A0ABW6G5H0_9PSEU|nr:MULTISPECIES: S8 family serine peptidase [Prauserella salsuginis group]MCR3718985.1 Subtilase family protein [Prauserella flava]MCR3733555.1 Subtilase family protein [Prauserella salsuginis]
MLGRRSLPLACAALAVAAQLTATTPAHAAHSETCHTDSRAWRYVVVFAPGTSDSEARHAVDTACGALTGYFPEIAVAVATSSDPDFDTALGPDRTFSAQRARHLRAWGSTTGATSRRTPRQEGAATAATGETGHDGVRTPDRTGEQWNLHMTGAPGVDADRTHPAQADLADVTVGVLDSGIDATHPDLAEAVDPAASAGCVRGVPDRRRSAWSARRSAHGTHVAGLVGAADDGRGITGTAPGVRLASLRVVDDDGYVTPEAAVCGYMWAARRSMAVANSSVTVAPSGVSCAASRGSRVVHEAVARAVEFAERSGTLTVAAATNDGFELGPLPHSELHHGGSAGNGDLTRNCVAVPAGLRNTVTVAAVDHRGTKTDYSSYGRNVIDLAAPGGSSGHCVLSTVPGGYDRMCGTSMAAPHVAGAAALLAASGSDGRSPDTLRRMLHRQARPIACPGAAHEDGACTGPREDNTFHGSGMVDAGAAHATHAVHRLLVRLGEQH